VSFCCLKKSRCHPSIRAAYSILFLVILSFIPFPAKAVTEPISELHALKIWDQTIVYRRILESDPQLDLDGESFIEDDGGRNIPYAVLNRAFLRQEARQLFVQLEKYKGHKTPSFPRTEKLKKIGEDLLAKKEGLLKSSAENLELKLTLERFQDALELAAWKKAFSDSWRQASSRKDAENKFVERVSEIRMATVERHEAAHLLDLAHGGERDNPDFDRFTELNAYFTELAYGKNPKDVFAETINGLVEELERGESVDFSLDKVLATLQLIKNDRRFSLACPKSWAQCYLKTLVRFTPKDFMLAGQALYHGQMQQQRVVSLAMVRISAATRNGS